MVWGSGGEMRVRSAAAAELGSSHVDILYPGLGITIKCPRCNHKNIKVHSLEIKTALSNIRIQPVLIEI